MATYDTNTDFGQYGSSEDPFMKTQQFRAGAGSMPTAPGPGATAAPTAPSYTDPNATAPGAGMNGWATPAAPPAAAPTGSGTVAWAGRSYDDTAITGWLKSMAGQPGINPSVANDPAYWSRRIKETGGLGADNTQFWQGLMLRPEGAPEGGGGGGAASGFTSFKAGGSVLDPSQGNELFQMLMGRAKQGTAVDPNDPIIRSQTDAFGAEQQRAERNYESALAERVGENANIDAERRMGAEKVGQSTSTFLGQLMAQERAAKRQEIQQALSGAQGYITAEQQMQLTQALHQMDLEEQSRQFGANLGQNAYQFDVNDQFRNSPLGS